MKKSFSGEEEKIEFLKFFGFDFFPFFFLFAEYLKFVPPNI